MYDVIVVGAGPAGSSTAYYLAKGGLKVALLDKSEFPRDKTCGDGITLRAIRALHSMGVLNRISRHAFQCNYLKLRSPNANEVKLKLLCEGDLPDYILIMPRFDFDDALRKHAMDAGVEFIPNAKVENITQLSSDKTGVRIEGHVEPIYCTLAVIAVGANTSLLKNLGFLQKAPPVNVAARCYFEGVKDLDESVTVIFDKIRLPGYAWVFPTSSTSANVGCGVFFDDEVPQTTRLRDLIHNHPLLQKILKDAKQVGPIKSFPLRTDYSSHHSGNGRVLVVGEALGLVNPFTGEGIDYALESGCLLAKLILREWNGGEVGVLSQKYRTALDERFRYQFMLTHLTQKIYMKEGMLNRLVERTKKSKHLQKMMIESSFGDSDAKTSISLRTFWELFRPQ